MLMVEDDDSIAVPLTLGLGAPGFMVSRAPTGAEALAAAPHDVVLLDLGLPDMDGFEVCRRLRALGGADHRGDRARRRGRPGRRPRARRRRLRRQAVRLPRAGRPHPRRHPPHCQAAPTSADRPQRRSAARSTAHPPGHARRRRGRAHAEGVRPARAARRRSGRGVHAASDILEEVWDPHWYGPTKTLDVHVASLRKKLGDPRLDRDGARRRLPARAGADDPARCCSSATCRSPPSCC